MRAAYGDEDEDGDAPNIFTINKGRSAREVAEHLEDVRGFFAHLGGSARASALAVSSRWRTVWAGEVDVAAQRREELQQRMEVLSSLNDITQQLLEVHPRLAKAGDSMRGFCDARSRCSLKGAEALAAFLRDAANLVKHALRPAPLEEKLAALESTADRFRTLSVRLNDYVDVDCSPPAAAGEDARASTGLSSNERAAVESAIADLQVDIAVLLESALMAAQQALAEYKRFFYRLQVLVREYEPVYLPAGASAPAMPLNIDIVVGGCGDMEARWAQDFVDLAAASVRNLAGHVKEVDRCLHRIQSCAVELRTLLVQGAA